MNQTFLEHVLPRVDQHCKALHAYSLRRKRFMVYQRRDQSLDLLCQRIIKLSCPDGSKQALVAFGDGTRVSTGFGYAPVPQKRLRFRLEKLHGARVTIIHEPYTSQTCHICMHRLEKKYIKKKYVHGIMVCPECKISDKHGNLHKRHHHRDVNACFNMVHIYQSLAMTNKRPDAFL